MPDILEKPVALEKKALWLSKAVNGSIQQGIEGEGALMQE